MGSMLQLRGVTRKDVYFRMELSARAAYLLKEFIDHADGFTYNSDEEPHMLEADRFMSEEFYPFLQKSVEEFGDGE